MPPRCLSKGKESKKRLCRNLGLAASLAASWQCRVRLFLWLWLSLWLFQEEQLPFVISSLCWPWQQTVRSSASVALIDKRTRMYLFCQVQVLPRLPHPQAFLRWRLNVSDSLSAECQGSGLNERLSSIDSAPKWLWVWSLDPETDASRLSAKSTNGCNQLAQICPLCQSSWARKQSGLMYALQFFLQNHPVTFLISV